MHNTQATVIAEISGVAPIIPHNGRLADPRNFFTKEVSEAATRVKKDKTDAAYELLAKVEWLGGLYHTEAIDMKVNLRDYSVAITGGGRPCIDGEMVEKMLHIAAPKNKKGAFKAGVYCEDQFPLLIHGKALTVAEAFEIEEHFFSKTAKIGRVTILRTRPRFQHWSTTVKVTYVPSLVNAKDITNALELGGAIIGLGDWRPKYGRFVLGKVNDN